MHSLSEREICEILDGVIVDAARRMGRMELQPGDIPPSHGVCTVYTQLQGQCNAQLAMCADGAFWDHMAQRVFEQEQVSPQDVEDVAKEYFNVVCGMVIAKMSALICRPTRFQIPGFCVGTQETHMEQGHTCVRMYTYDQREQVQLVLTYSPPK